MASITLEGLKKTYSGDVHAVQGIDLDIQDGELIVLVGPSGCGKSTLLRMVAGLETITQGTLKIDRQVVNKLEPAERDIAMVFQNYALYPHMTVYKNLAYGLKNRGFKKHEIKERVHNAAKILEIEDFLERKPRRLSGGQRQRVAMGRALVRDPKVFLFDEPLSNLDAKLRVQMRVEIKKLQRRLKTTSLYVTHDQLEAMTLGDRLVVLNAGKIEQVGTPMEIYSRPATMFVAGFIGSPAMNMVPLKHIQDSDNKNFMNTLHAHTDTIGIRPDDMCLSPPDSTHLAIEATLEMFEEAGPESHLYIRLASCDQPAVIRISGQPPQQESETLHIYIAHEALHPFDSRTGKRTD